MTATARRCALICPGVAATGFQDRADARKYPRITRLVSCSVDKVADVTVQALARRTHGEVITPWHARPIVAVGAAFPGLARLVLRIIR